MSPRELKGLGRRAGFVTLICQCLMMFALISVDAVADEFVAGTSPDRRPEAAPVLDTARADQIRAREAQHGIEEPVPDSVTKVIESQGAWHTPFSHPGMPQPYDLRGWHVDGSDAARDRQGEYIRAWLDRIHLPENVIKATDADCLACHQDVLTDTVRESSPAGVRAEDSIAWYQSTLAVYDGPQDTFHRRHLTSPLAKELMNLTCNTCHEGHDARDETVGSAADTVSLDSTAFTLRKTVNPERACLKCHGQFDYQVMNLPGPWHQVAGMLNNDCMACHAAFRTNRHQVSYLNAEAIEAAGKESADSCFGCHGGRPWYRISYPYPRNAWPGMSPVLPDWAKSRPTESEARFRLDAKAEK